MERSRWVAGIAAVLSMGVAGCAERSIEPVGGPSDSEVGAVENSRLDGAAVFACESDETIQVRFNYDPASVTLRRASGETLDLPLEDFAEMETYASGPVRIAVGPGDARFEADGDSSMCEGVSQPLGPPAIDGVVRELRQSDDGATVELAVGDTFSVALVGVPTAGYQWSAPALPDFLEEAGNKGGATSTAQFLPGFAGGNHWEVLAFRATAAGSGELVFEERRPFESSEEPAADTFRVSISVR